MNSYPIHKNLLVTGAAGFIGSHVCKHFLRSGWNVMGLDNFFTGSRKKIEDFSSYNNWSFLEEDILAMHPEILIKNQISHVIHLAAIGKVRYSIAHPDKTYKVNVYGTQKIIDACNSAKIERIIFTSSSSVYGQQPLQPNREEFLPNPLSPYAKQKLESEQDLIKACRDNGLQVVILRLFNVFGPGQTAEEKYPALIPTCISRMKQGLEIPILGDGNQVRDFTFIQNVVNAIELALKADKKEAIGIPINIGTGNGTSINSVVEILGNLLDMEIKKIFYPAIPEALENTSAIERAKSILGYEPHIFLEEGLKRTID